jgi:chemotaxis protein methyltransferase CheR
MTSSALLSTTPRAPLVEGEFDFTRRNFAQIATLLYEMAGITLSEAKATLVYSRLAKRVRTLGLESFDDYCALIAAPDGDDERARMLNALTTNLTRFFREPHHFDHLRDNVLSPMVDRVKAGGRLRLWSAGCSSGQEVFSIALTVLSVIPDAAKLDVKILGTDVDTNMIAQGAAAVYPDDLLEGIPLNLRSHCLERLDDQPGHRRFNAEVRSLTTFKPLNLMGSWPLKGPFQAIFCRNVAIYFDEPTQERVWNRFNPLLEPGGRIYIGHSERLGGAGKGYVNDGLTVYRSRPAAMTQGEPS